MQSTRFLAATMLRQQPAMSMLRYRAMQTRGLRLQATPVRRMPVPKQEQSAHTISQRLRTLKKVPPELIPLAVVLAIALVAAGYSMVNKLFSDKTLRLGRSGKSAEH